MVFEILTVVNTVAILVLAYDITRVARMRKQSGAPRDADHVETVLSFGPTTIEAKSTMVFSVSPRTNFAGTRLIIPSGLVGNFNVNDIRANGKSMLAAPGEIPAAAFSEAAVGVALDMPEIAVGKHVLLSISNTTDAPQTFSAALMGLAPKKQFDALPPLAPNATAN